jgi:glycosyltransferase involved in cell wall biosynthesis
MPVLAAQEAGRVAAVCQREATVCHVLHSLDVGGAEVLAARMGRGMQDRFRLLFVCLDDLGTLGTQLRAEGFPVHVVERRPGIDLRCVRRLGRLLRDEQVDVIHAHQYTPFFYSLLARLFYRRAPVLFMEHGRTFPDYRRPKRVLANRLLLRRRDRVVAVGESVRQALIQNEGIAGQRVSVIYNGVDLSPFERSFPRAAVRGELQVEPDDFVILQVARLDALKDHATALRALRRVLARIPHARLLLAGEGPELRAIREQVARENLGDQVRLLGLRSDVPRLLAAADLCLLSSVSEGIPLTIIEAMGAGLAVVSTAAGGVAEVVEHGQTGLLAAVRDDYGLAEAIVRLQHDRALRTAMGERGRQRAFERFSEPGMHAAYAHLYREMIQS